MLSGGFGRRIELVCPRSDRPAIAGEDKGDLINYSFAVWLGSGVYKVSDADKKFAVLRVPLRYTLQEAQDYQLPLREKIGFKLLLPALLAYQKETQSNTDFSAGAFVPGLEVQIPVKKYWTLKPFAQFGAGKDTGGGDLKYIYGGGLKNLICIPWYHFCNCLQIPTYPCASQSAYGWQTLNCQPPVAALMKPGLIPFENNHTLKFGHCFEHRAG